MKPSHDLFENLPESSNSKLREDSLAMQAPQPGSGAEPQLIAAISCIEKQLDSTLSLLGQPDLSPREQRKQLRRYRTAKGEILRLRALLEPLPDEDLPSDEEVEMARALADLRGRVGDITMTDIRLAANMRIKSEMFGLPLPDFEVDSAEEDELVNSCRIPELPALKQFMSACFDAYSRMGVCSHKDEISCFEIEKFCRNSSKQQVMHLIRDIDKCMQATAGLTVKVMNRILTEKLEFQGVPANLRSLPDLRTWLQHYCRQYHSDSRRS